MTQWYYADAQRQRQGPIDTPTLRARLDEGVITPASLVWREGLAQWVTLGEIAAELESPPSPSADTAAAAPAHDGPATPAQAPAGAAAHSADGQAAVTDNEGLTQAATPAPADPGEASAAQPTPPAAPQPTDWPPSPAPAVASAMPAPVVYAGLWRRLAASILDGFVTTFAVYLLVIPLVLGLSLLGMGNMEAAFGNDEASVAMMIIVYGLSLLLPTLYFAWMQSTRYQASLGKLACGIKVVRSDGSHVGFWRNFLRYLAYMLISVLTLGIGAVVSAFMAALGARKQALHDKVCDTLVVDRWAYTPTPERQKPGLDTVTIVVLAIYAVMLLLGLVFFAIMMAAIGMGSR
ncbi:RDD family protein [Xanthomonas maliensis]|uniref:RDD family protein n=1 Tax=Xanthomonas maliensis TaxID=1321368 RepID=UPI0003A17BDA|nr:RDD family protein [Xanthomonas maliensis]